MPGTLYRQHSADPFLYVADDTPDCWSAFLLNTNENYTDPTIDFKKIWSGSGISTRYNGSILFCRTAPAQLGPDYHEQLRTLIREKVGEVWSFCLVWIMDPDAPLSTDNLYVLPLWERTTSQYEVKREDTFVALDGIAEWTFLETVRAVSDIQNNYSEVRFPTSPSTGLNTRPHAMTFGLRLSGGQRATERQSDQIPADTYIAIPTNGPGCGCIRFEMDLLEQDDLLAFDLGQRFFYSADGNGSLAQFHYPLLRSARAGYRLRFQVSLDPANLTNRKADPEAAEFPTRTYLAFTGHTEHTSGGQIILESTVLESHLATHNGYGLDLAPYLQSLANPSALHPLMAGEESARIVFCEKRTGSQEAYYAPAGSFSLLLKSSDREQAIVDDRVYLQSGLSGTESLAYSPDNGNRIHFLPYRPAFSPQFPLESGDSSDVPLLTDECQTSWITLQADGGPQNLYLSQPEGASLYTQSHGINAVTPITPAMLGHFQPAVELPGDLHFCVPAAPYRGVQPDLLVEPFEAQVLSAVRRQRILQTQPPPAPEAASVPSLIASATPQGLIARVESAGPWKEVILAENTIGYTSPNYQNHSGGSTSVTSPEFKLGFINLSQTLKEAFLTNQQFLVCTDAAQLGALFTDLEAAGTPSETTADPVFNNKMYLQEWPFFLQTGKNGSVAGEYRNILICKFCKGALVDWVKNPAVWTQAGDFNDPTELRQLSQWLQDYLAEAQGQESEYFAKFNELIVNEHWNGILALKLDLSPATFPEALSGLLGGIDESLLNIHHFGIEINHVDAVSGVQLSENSSMFGLIYYQDPGYLAHLAAGNHPDLPVQDPPGGEYDFTVLTLQVLFENSDIKDFASKVQVSLYQLMKDEVVKLKIEAAEGEEPIPVVQPQGGQTPADVDFSVLLNGTYEEHDGQGVYIFSSSRSNKFYLDTNIINYFEIEQAYFDTLSKIDDHIEARFRFYGNLNFKILEGSTTPLDLLSFGSEPGMADTDFGKGLHFSNLYLDMSFDLGATPNRTFDMRYDYFSLSMQQSYARENSLYRNFPLDYQGFLLGGATRLPEQLGFLPVSTPAIELNEASWQTDGAWFGLKYKLSLGTPGSLASEAGWESSLLVAWTPGDKATDTTYSVFLGIILPGASGNSKLLSLQGLLKVAMDDIVLDYTSRTNADNSVDSAYVLELIDIGIKLFNIAKLPITSSTNFFLFSDASAAKKKNLGWALSYAQKNSLGIFDLPFFAMGQHLSLTHPERVVDMGTAMEEMKTAFFPNGDPFTTTIKQEFVLGATDDESDPAAQQLVFNDDSNWLIAFKFGLLGSTGSGGGSQSSDSDDQNGSDSGDPIDVESEFNVQLSVLFNDPEMYGARIEVGGDAVKVFDGLQFEILYKKITESIGLFHTELALPSKFRKFKAGAAQITLPILALDIYTNGDFKIDLGFPYDLDFSRSFSIEVQAGPFPLLGSGGFYFGKLSGDTATGLPVTTRGIFDPVMVFGLGLEAGFGKSFEEGPLSASFKITLVGIVEGTIATFTPNEPTTGSSTDIEASHYYKISGTLGIVGILEGSVDFEVIKASVYVEVYALIKAVFEAYKPVPVTLSAGVEVSVTVEVDLLFETMEIEFSFSTQVRAEFVIGSDKSTQAPWYDGAQALGATFAQALAAGAPFSLQDIALHAPATLDLYLSLQPSAGDNDPSMIALLLIESTGTQSGGSAKPAFDQLAEDVFRWVVKSWTGSSATEVSRQNLQDVLTALNDRSNPVMTLEMIEKFLDTNYDLRIHTISSQADCPNPTVFPVHPDLQLEMETSLRTSAGTTPSTQTVSFSTFSTCSREGYLDHLNAYFQEPAGSSVPSANGAKASLAAFIFQDYFNLIAKHMVQEALSSLKNFSHLLGSADSLQTILGHYQALNSQLTLDDLSLNNQFHLLREGVELPLTSEVHIVGAGETLHSVAQTLGLSLADLAGEVQNVEGLFNTAADPYFQLLDLEWSNIEELVADLANNRASVNLSGMIARYYLGGLRLPVLGDLALADNSLLAGADYGLYRLTGQQFALPEIPTATGVSLDEYRVKMQGGPAWIHFGTPDAQGNHPASISYSYAGQQIAEQVSGVEGALPGFSLSADFLPAAGFQEVARRFKFKSFYLWNHSTAVSLQTAAGAQEAVDEPMIWNFSDGLLNHLAANAGSAPDFSVKLGLYNSATGRMDYSSLDPLSWGTLLDLTIKRTPDASGEDVFRYELVGTDEVGVVLLEKLLLSGLFEGNSQIQFLYASQAGEEGATELEALDVNELYAFVARANLSTETNPPPGPVIGMALAASFGLSPGILNEGDEFLRFLWESSILRSGGYYLYYRPKVEQAGDVPEPLPAHLFGDDGFGALKVLIKFSAQTQPTEFMNCALTARGFDLEQALVFAEAGHLSYNVALLPQSVWGYRVERDIPVAPVKGSGNYYSDYLSKMYQMLAYQLQGTGDLAGGNMGVPVGPTRDLDMENQAEADRKRSPSSPTDWDAWLYQLNIPVYQYAQTAPQIGNEPDPYAGIGDTASLRFEWRDIYGNRVSGAGTEFTEDAVMLKYSDKLLPISLWQNIASSYSVSKPDPAAEAFELIVSLAFDPPDLSELDPEQTANFLADKKSHFAKIFYQLNEHVTGNARTSLVRDPHEMPLSAGHFGQLRQYLIEVYDYLDQLAQGITPVTPAPLELRFSFSEQQLSEEDLYELSVELRWERATNLIDPQVAADPEVGSARSVILPEQIGSADPTGGTNGLQNFAQQFEAVFAEQKLKIATGINRSDLNTSKKARDIWVVDMDAFSTTVEAAAPKYYALKPLSTKLESLQGINVYTYSSTSGLDMNTAVYQNFSAIDMDDWARQFLEAVDQVLSPKMATAAFLVDQIVGTAHLSALTDAKKALAGSIVQFLSPIYDGVTFSDIEMEAAREKLQQQLLIRLSNANLINTVVQFPVTITSELAGGRRLYGKPFVQAAGNSGDRNFAFSTAKIDLGASDPLLTFLFDTKHDEASATVDFDLELRITHLEHEIEAHETDNLSGYESSSWLAFVNFDDQLRKDLGHVDIPVPLRAYPTPPGLQRQAAVQSTAEPGKSDLQNATQWDYRVTYLQQTAAQDRIKAQIALNRQPPPATASAMMAGGRSLLEELATFLYHYPAIQAELVANLSLITAQTAPDDAAVLAAERAMNAFVTLVIAVSEAWPYWAPGQNAVTTVELVGDIHFDLTLEEGSQDDTDDGLLEIEVAPVAIDPAEIVLATPKVEVSGDLGANLSGTDVARYQYGLTFKQAKGITERTLILEDLNILDYQNAIMKISVSRNEQLSPGVPTDPDFMSTNPDFIYRTSEIQFPNHLVPLLDNEIGIDMAEEVLGENQPLEAYLSKFLEKLLFRQEGDVQTLKLSCSYVYSIHPSGDPDLAAEERTFEIALPILLIPPYEVQIRADLDPSDPASFVSILAGGIRSWYANHLPADGNLNERFLFDLAVFSKMNASKLPILRLRNVYLRRDSVSDL